MYDDNDILDDLEELYSSSLQLDGWSKDTTKEFIYVGEYGLALDSISFAYVVNKSQMSPEAFTIFERLGHAMDLFEDTEYPFVGEMQKLQASV